MSFNHSKLLKLFEGKDVSKDIQEQIMLHFARTFFEQAYAREVTYLLCDDKTLRKNILQMYEEHKKGAEDFHEYFKDKEDDPEITEIEQILEAIYMLKMKNSGRFIALSGGPSEDEFKNAMFYYKIHSQVESRKAYYLLDKYVYEKEPLPKVSEYIDYIKGFIHKFQLTDKYAEPFIEEFKDYIKDY